MLSITFSHRWLFAVDAKFCRVIKVVDEKLWKNCCLQQKVIDSFSLFKRENASTRFSDPQLFLIDNTKYVSVLLLSTRKYDRWRFVIFVFVVFSLDPDSKLCSSAGPVRFQNVCLSRCHGIFYRRNTIKQCEEFNCTKRSEACQKEIGHRCCNFLFSSSTFDFYAGAILKTLDKVNSLSSIQALSFGENEVGKFCVLQILGAPCVKTLIDHKKPWTTNCGR